MKNIIGVLVATVFWLTPLSAQVSKVTLSVDGLACAFCAYGLRKGLKKIEGVRDATVYVDAGRAELQVKPGAPVALEEIAPTVKKAGYTVREIKVEVTGRLADWNDRPALAIDETGEKFLLNGNDQVKRLREAAGAKVANARVTVIATVEHATPPQHHGHPVTLRVEKFSVEPER